MTTTMNQASPALAQEYHLTQAAFRALGHCFATVMKFDPVKIVIKDSILFTLVAEKKALVQANYTPLISKPVSMAFAADKAAIKQMASIHGAGDVHVRVKDGQYRIQGDYTGARFPVLPMPEASYFTLPTFTWLGVEVAGYDPKDLSAYIGKVGKKSKAVHLAVYDDQLEQISVEGQGAPYTFTAGMANHLASRRPNLVLLSRVAFRHFGKKQSLRLGTANGRHFLQVTNSFDIGVDLVVIECLGAVVTG